MCWGGGFIRQQHWMPTVKWTRIQTCAPIVAEVEETKTLHRLDHAHSQMNGVQLREVNSCHSWPVSTSPEYRIFFDSRFFNRGQRCSRTRRRTTWLGTSTILPRPYPTADVRLSENKAWGRAFWRGTDQIKRIVGLGWFCNSNSFSSKELDQKLERVWSEAQEATDKNALFRQTYNTLMDQEESQIKRTAKYLQDTVPIRDELFETLCVTLQTEKHAIEVSWPRRLFLTHPRPFQNAAELQLNYRRRMKDALSSRTRLQQKIRTFRHQFDKTQEQKRASYDEVMELLNEIDRLEAMEQLHCLGNPTN